MHCDSIKSISGPLGKSCMEKRYSIEALHVYTISISPSESFEVSFMWFSFYIRRKLFHPSPRTRFIHRLSMCYQRFLLLFVVSVVAAVTHCRCCRCCRCATEMQLFSLRFGSGVSCTVDVRAPAQSTCRTTPKTIKFNVIALQLLLKFYYGINTRLTVHSTCTLAVWYSIYIWYTITPYIAHIERTATVYGRCLSHCHANNKHPRRYFARFQCRESHTKLNLVLFYDDSMA